MAKLARCMIKGQGRGPAITLKGGVGEMVAFVARAICTDETRYFMTCLNVERSEADPGSVDIVATDGRRLHRVTIESTMEPGLYEAIAMKKNEITIARIIEPEALYPNWRRVVPGENESEKLVEVIGEYTGERKDSKGEFIGFQRFIFTIPQKVLFNLNYIADISEYSWSVSVSAAPSRTIDREKTKKIEHAVRFDRAEGAMMAVIMPCSID